MKVYILYIDSKTFKEIAGVYSTREKAQEKRDKFLKWAGGLSNVQARILERILDNDDAVFEYDEVDRHGCPITDKGEWHNSDGSLWVSDTEKETT